MMPNWTSDRRIYVDAEGNEVPEGDAKAAYLLVAEGAELTAEQARALGVELDEAGQPKARAAGKAVAGPEETKAQEPPAEAPPTAPSTRAR